MGCRATGCIVMLILSVLGAPLAAEAQPPSQVPRIGFLSGSALTPELARGLEAFRQALREHGWVEGHNLVIESRSAEGHFERLPTLAAELVGLHVDVTSSRRGRKACRLPSTPLRRFPSSCGAWRNRCSEALSRAWPGPAGTLRGLRVPAVT